MPRIASACSRASSSSLATLIPPALPRPADRDLRLDHARVADLVRRRRRRRRRSSRGGPRARARRAWRRAACPGIRGGPWRAASLSEARAVVTSAAFAHNARRLVCRSQAERHQVGDHRLLRHPDRLGEGDPRRLQRRRPSATASVRRARRCIKRFFEVQAEIMAGSYELYAEVLRRAAVKVAERDRLGARALAGPVPARQRRPLAALPRGERGDGPARRSATRSGSSPTSTTSCSASRAGTCAPSSTSSSPPSRCAATSPTPPTSRRPRAGSAARRAGSTSAPATRPTSRRC